MWIKDNVLRNGNRIVFLLGQILVILACIVYIDFIYITNIIPDRRVRSTFVETNCTLISKILNTHGGIVQGYRADFFLSYKTADGRDFKRWAYGNGLDDTFAETSGRSSAILSQYEVGGEYPCYYDPTNPEQVVLVLREKWLSIIPVVIPASIMLVMLYLLIRSILKFPKRSST